MALDPVFAVTPTPAGYWNSAASLREDIASLEEEIRLREKDIRQAKAEIPLLEKEVLTKSLEVAEAKLKVYELTAGDGRRAEEGRHSTSRYEEAIAWAQREED